MALRIKADIYDQETYNNVVLLIDAFESAALESETREGILMAMQGPILGYGQILDGAEETLERMKKIGAPPDMSKMGDPTPGGGYEVQQVNTSDGFNYYPGDAEGFSVDRGAGGLPLPSLTIGGGSVSGEADWLGEMLNLSEKEAEALNAYMYECWNCNTRITFNWQIPLIDLLAPILSLLTDINEILERLEDLTNPVNFLRNFCKWMNWFALICPADWISLLMALKMLFTKYLTFSLSIKLDWTVLLGPLINFIVEALTSLIRQIAGVVVNPLDCLIGIFNTLVEVEFQGRDTYATMKAAKDEFKARLEEIARGEVIPNARTSFVMSGVYWDPIKKEFVRVDQSVALRDKYEFAANSGKKTNPWEAFVSGAKYESARNMKEAIQHPKREDMFFYTFVGAVKEAKDYILEISAQLIETLNSIKGLCAGGLSVQLESLGFMLLILQMIRMVLMIIKLIQSNKDVTDWCDYLEKHPEKLEDALKEFVDPGSSAKEGRVTVKGHSIDMTSCISSRDPQESVMLSKWISELTEKTNAS